MKKFLQISLILIVALVLSGCSNREKVLTKEEFERVIASQKEPSLKDFQNNYDTAKSLLGNGVLPIGEMPLYDPFAQRNDAVNQGIMDGFYAVSLDEEIFGVSRFYILPLGLRPMTANEYLLLAQASDLSAKEMIQTDNSWLVLQERQSNANRSLTRREQFWLDFQANEVFRQREDDKFQKDIPLGIYVGYGEQRENFVLYPAGEMNGKALQEAGMIMYRYLISESERSLWVPTSKEIQWKQAVAKAVEAVAAQDGLHERPERDYVQYHATESDDGSRTGSWTVALYYADGQCFFVKLNSADGDVLSLEQLPDNFLDLSRTWSPDETIPN